MVYWDHWGEMSDTCEKERLVIKNKKEERLMTCYLAQKGGYTLVPFLVDFEQILSSSDLEQLPTASLKKM